MREVGTPSIRSMGFRYPVLSGILSIRSKTLRHVQMTVCCCVDAGSSMQKNSESGSGLVKALRAAGYSSILSLQRAHPTLTFLELADLITAASGVSVAAIELQRLTLTEISTDEELTEYMRIAL